MVGGNWSLSDVAIPYRADPSLATRARNQREFDQCLWLLYALHGITDGLPVDQPTINVN